MRLTTLTCVAALFGVGSVLAGGTAQAATKPMAPLGDKQCQAAWKMAAPVGDALSKGKAEPFVMNFTMVDTDHNGKITLREFEHGCKAGWIRTADTTTVKDMKK